MQLSYAVYAHTSEWSTEEMLMALRVTSQFLSPTHFRVIYDKDVVLFCMAVVGPYPLL